MRRFSIFHAVAISIVVLAGAASLSAAQAGTGANQETPDNKEIRAYQLTTDKLSRFESAAKAIATQFKDNPNLEQQLTAASRNNAGPNTIAQSAAALDKFPQLTGAIKPLGFSSHEYIVMTFALANASSYVEMKKSSPNAPLPPTVSAANAAFAAANEVRIQAVIQILSQ
ncbi:MAG: hypothetical protein ABSA32_11355 [Candidatus Acidiferrales bacterium]|jgi:hypothetical protein